MSEENILFYKISCFVIVPYTITNKDKVVHKNLCQGFNSSERLESDLNRPLRS